MNVKISDIEYFLPANSESNEDLLRDNPEWDMAAVAEKVGVKTRRVAAEGQCASDLGIEAAKKILAKKKAGSIDAMIFCTQSPDYFLPTSACVMQDKLGLPTSVAAFDINLGCSGYVYGLAIGSSLIESGLYSNVLLICADTYTRYINKTDRTCKPIFGDAGSATLLTKTPHKQYIGPFVLGTDGKGAENLIVAGGAARNGQVKPVIRMDGPEVFAFSMLEVPKNIEDLLSKTGKKIDDIDYFFFHQASKLILDNVANYLSIPEDKIYRGYENIGNTVSASIPIALKQASEENRLNAGDRLLLAGFGVGYSWGACLVQWSGLDTAGS